MPATRNPSNTRTPIDRRADRLALLALVWAAAAGIALALVPMGSSSTTSSDSPIVTTTHESLLHEEGASVLVVVAIPALLALAATVVRRRPVRLAIGGLLGLGCLVGAMSIGVFFVPAAVLLLCAASATPGPRSAEPSHRPRLEPHPPRAS